MILNITGHLKTNKAIFVVMSYQCPRECLWCEISRRRMEEGIHTHTPPCYHSLTGFQTGPQMCWFWPSQGSMGTSHMGQQNALSGKCLIKWQHNIGKYLKCMFGSISHTSPIPRSHLRTSKQLMLRVVGTSLRECHGDCGGGGRDRAKLPTISFPTSTNGSISGRGKWRSFCTLPTSVPSKVS